MIKLKSTVMAVTLVALFAFASSSGYAQKPQASPVPSEVSVVNTPTVVVGNGNDNPIAVRNVAEPAREHYQLGGVVTWQQCDPNVFSTQRTFSVPQGKRFVIEHVSFRNWFSVLDPNEGLWIEIWTTFNGELRARSLNFSRQRYGNADLFIANHPMLAYADGGTEVMVRVHLATPPFCSQSSSPPVAHGLMSGYLVNMP